jgi:type II secretory ATPase GspE/PulE/Tfp pilus assembly ATPase PilB-like protein
VLSTLHTNNASESVVRLLDLGMDPMNFADSLLGIVAQRLVRALCTHCAAQRPLSGDEWNALLQEYMEGSDLSIQQASARLLAAAGVSSPQELKTRHAVGCEQCGARATKAVSASTKSCKTAAPSNN